MKNLIAFFSKKPLLVNLLMIFVIFYGFISLSKTNKEGYPQVDRKQMYVSTIYPGASVHEVELNVTIPLEEAISGVEGIDYYTSVSRENFSYIRIYLDQDVPDAEKVKTDIRRVMDNVILPSEVSGRPEIWEWKVASVPIIEIGLFSETLSYTQLRTRARDLRREIQQLPDVAQVQERNILDREVKVKVNLDKLNQNYISIQEIIHALQVNNFQMTSGVFQDNSRDKTITVYSKLQTAGDVKNIILRSTFEGKQIYIKDVARVYDDYEEQYTRIRLNGEDGVSLLVVKKEASDIIKSVDAIKEKVDSYRQSLENEDLDITYLWDMSAQTRMRLDIVQNNALMGLGLVVIILFLFMNFKNAFWTALGIPFSVAFAMIFFRQFGITINSVSLLGVIVVLGMVVDDAIVISENIYRHRIQGKSWQESAVIGTSEVAYPVITTIVTTIVSFLALYNLKGIIGEFSREIPLVVIFVLAGSLVESLLVLPNHISHQWRKRKEPVKIRERRFVIYLREKYIKALRWVLNRRYLVLVIFAILFAASYYVLFSGKVLRFIAFPTDETTAIYLNAETAYGQNIDYTSQKVRIIENALLEYPDDVVESFSVRIGDIGYPEKFNFKIDITPSGKRKIRGDDIVTNLRQVMDNHGYFTNIFFTQESGGPPLGRAITIQVVGNDDIKRRKIADEFHNYLKNINGTRDVTRSDEEDKRELRLVVNYEKAARLGVSPLVIGQTMRASYHGVIATKVQTPDEQIEYRVMLQDKYRNDLRTIKNLYVPNNQNRLVKLESLVSAMEMPMVSKIDHYNGDRNTIIEADVDEDKITPKEILDMINRDFKDFELKNPGFRLFIGGEAQATQETIDEMIFAFFVALVAIFFILILLFRSAGQAIMVIFAIPFSFIGVAIALLTHNMPLSAMALFGGVGLVGVVVNDSLVMVDYINSQRRLITKANVIDVIIEGAATRMRPVILTTLTTVAGLLPTAYGFGGRDFMIIPCTISMSWGLIFATFLTLFLIPTLYLTQYKLKQRFRRIFKLIRLAGKKTNLKRILHKTKVLPFIIALGLTAITGTAFSDTVKTEKVILLSDFIEEASDNSPEILGELIKLRSAESLEIQARAIYNAVLDFNYYNFYQNPQDPNQSNVGITEQWGDNFYLGIGRVFPRLGTRARAGIEYTQTDTHIYYPDLSTIRLEGYTNISIADMQNYLTNVKNFSPKFVFELKQPMLKNWFGIIDTFPIKQAQLNRMITEKAVDDGIEAVIIRLYDMYFEWFEAYNQLRIFEENIRNGDILLKQVKEKAEFGLVEQSDVHQVYMMNLEYKKARDLIQVNIKRLTRQIYHWMKGSLDMPQDFVFIPQSRISLPDIPHSPYSVTNSRTMQILELSRQILDYQLEKELNERLPELNVVFKYEFANPTTDPSRAFIITNFNHNFYAGIEFAFPIGENMSRGKIKETKSRIRKWVQDTENFRRNYMQGIEDLNDMLRVYETILEYDAELIRHAERRVAEEERKYEQGRSDLFYIIQNKHTLVDYRLKHLENYVKYHKIKLELLGVLDSIELPERRFR